MISLTLTLFIALFYITIGSDSYGNATNYGSSAKSSSVMLETKYYENYENLKAPSNTVVIYPIFTQSAYAWDGIHDFYTGRCDSCSTTPIQTSYEKRLASSGNVFTVLEFLGYNIIDDIILDKNPEILEKYDKVILLHNEFVTQNEFDAITNHPNVIYFYPNSLSSKIEVDYDENSISLKRGPSFPNESITNGFDWVYDNSEYLYDWDCKNWKFEKIDNGHMLNCYPEQKILDDGYELLYAIKSL